MTSLRLLPMVLVASTALLTLKVADLWINGRPGLAGITAAAAQTKPEKEPAKKEDREEVEERPKGPEAVRSRLSTKMGKITNNRPVERSSAIDSSSKRSVLERLGERRIVLEKRAKELDLREALLQATEMRIETRVAELKQMEARVGAAVKRKKDAEDRQFDDLVKMYEAMKPKEAARIFDRLDMKILVRVVKKVNPRRMADVLGKMTPETAERLTVALATKRDDLPKKMATMLPKIGSDTR